LLSAKIMYCMCLPSHLAPELHAAMLVLTCRQLLQAML
jgi:hypothetical protein